LTTPAASGTCSAGSCSYAPTNQVCEFGCANGACKPDPCAAVTCDTPPTAKCKNASTKTTYAATGTCSDGDCNYVATDTACASNQACGGQGVCAVCKTDASCGGSCSACAGATPKCKDETTTSKCVECVSNNDCAGAKPICNTTTNVCEPRSCAGLAKTCGPTNNQDCCGTNPVIGGTFNRSNDANYPATISTFALDTYEVTVGRFRKFVAAYSKTMIAAGAGKNPNNASDTGWNTAWNASLPADAAALRTALKCDTTLQTWTDSAGTAAAESRPINCLNWYEAEAFCTWDGGRLPTEAEWNYAAAGGTAQRIYPWGSSTPDCTYANYKGAAGDFCVAPGVGGTNRVGSESNRGDGPFGHADMAGNVEEWVQDWYASDYTNPCTNCARLVPPVVIASPDIKVFRGGNYSANAAGLMTSKRGSSTPDFRFAASGARCARAQ
jgi:formylglycine-generating enzyme